MPDEEANETLKYVLSKYEEVEMKIVGEPINIYGLRLSHGSEEEELNIHFKYVDNTQQDIIQNCVFVLYHRSNECELIRTICNTFLPITPRPLVQRKDLRVCNDEVQLVDSTESDGGDDDDAAAADKDDTDADDSGGDKETTTKMTTADAEQRQQVDVDGNGNDDDDDAEAKQDKETKSL